MEGAAMKLTLLVAGASLCLTAAASAQGAKAPPEQALLGTWTCSGKQGDATMNITTTYLAGGKEIFDVEVRVIGLGLSFTGSGTGDWKFQQDGRLAETMTALTVKTAMLDGLEKPAASVQPILESTLLNQISTSTVELTNGRMILVDENDAVTTCKG